VQNETNKDSEKSKATDVRAIARNALLQLLEPLAGFVSDSGLSTSELNAIYREAAVISAVAKQLEVSDRVNISGIAATTGISRGAISRILQLTAKNSERAAEGQQQSTNRILAAWREDPKFTDAHGQPADLKLYGRGITFEALAKKYGRGIPTRAVLDELVRGGAVELLSTQRVRAKAYMAVERGMSVRAIKAFGDRASELLSTMLLNMKQPETPRFIASVSETLVSPSSLPLFRRELSIKAADFLADIREHMGPRRAPRPPAKFKDGGSVRIGVTIFYHESCDKKGEKAETAGRRRNFRRAV
jgi:hypothetical protein